MVNNIDHNQKLHEWRQKYNMAQTINKGSERILQEIAGKAGDAEAEILLAFSKTDPLLIANHLNRIQEIHRQINVWITRFMGVNQIAALRAVQSNSVKDWDIIEVKPGGECGEPMREKHRQDCARILHATECNCSILNLADAVDGVEIEQDDMQVTHEPPKLLPRPEIVDVPINDL